MKCPTDSPCESCAAMPSKAEELRTWQAFRASLVPGSYLALYLADSDGLLERAMQNDMAIEALADIRKRRDEATAEAAQEQGRVTELVTQRNALQKTVERMRRDVNEHREALRDIAKAASTLSVCASQSFLKAGGTP